MVVIFNAQIDIARTVLKSACKMLNEFIQCLLICVSIYFYTLN